MKFKSGDIVYCIDNMVYDEMESDILKLDTPYIVKNSNGLIKCIRICTGDEAKKIFWRDYFWTWCRFITKEEYNIKKSLEIL